MPSSYIHTLSSFSGSDLSVSFANKILGNCQSISWGIQREKVPVFTLGSPDARSISRGKRAVGGALVFAAFDHDALLQAMKEIWHIIAPPAMFTAAGNLALQGSEDFSRAMDLSKWNASGELSFTAYNELAGAVEFYLNYVNQTWQHSDDADMKLTKTEMEAFNKILIGTHNMDKQVIQEGIQTLQATPGIWQWIVGNTPVGSGLAALKNGFVNLVNSVMGAIDDTDTISGQMAGFSGTGELKPTTMAGSNNKWDYQKDIWKDSDAQIYSPQGFSPIRGQNVTYADIIPPFDITLTFANEYGQCAFKKIYDCDILNEGSGVSVDTVVMEQQFSYIARRVSPLTKGVYTRESGGMVKGIPPVFDAGTAAKFGYQGPTGKSYVALP